MSIEKDGGEFGTHRRLEAVVAQNLSGALCRDAIKAASLEILD